MFLDFFLGQGVDFFSKKVAVVSAFVIWIEKNSLDNVRVFFAIPIIERASLD